MLARNDIPGIVIDLLDRVQTLCPEAIIAGGYLRDLDHDIRPKDIDIFVGFDTNVDTLRCLLTGEDINDSVVNEANRLESAENDDTIHMQMILTNVPGFEMLPVNILICKRDVEPISRLDRFDFGLCQIYFDGKVMGWTLQYQYDKIHKVFTHMRWVNWDDMTFSWGRWIRFQDRYPGYGLVIPYGQAEPTTQDAFPTG